MTDAPLPEQERIFERIVQIAEENNNLIKKAVEYINPETGCFLPGCTEQDQRKVNKWYLRVEEIHKEIVALQKRLETEYGEC